MAKDPAFLFYYDRFISGTYSMSNEEVGAYIRLLCIQANRGFITEKDLNNTRITSVKDIQSKFIEISPGVFRNEVLYDIMEDRKKFTESRRSNRLGKKKEEKNKELVNNTSYSLEKLVVNVNKDININTKEEGMQGEKPGIYPGSDDMGMDIPDLKVSSVIQLLSAVQQVTLTNEQVKLMWQAFKAQHFTGEKYYKSINEIYSHFINWSKQQKIKNGQQSIAKVPGRGAGTLSYLDRLAAKYATGHGGDHKS